MKFLPIGALTMLIIIVGISLRFYIQFLDWSFNGDEVNLGLEIINNSFKELFYPFQNKQSAPPLFLLVEKFISGIGKPYISLKLLSFLSSCASIFLFNRILKNSFHPTIHLLILALFCFNPFILSNSLTLKQYTLDLTLGLVAISYFCYEKKLWKTFLFYSIFCLLSNVGLFFCAAFTIFHFSVAVSRRKIDLKTFKELSPYLLAPIPYLLFFLWFMSHPGAVKMQHYMVNYWNSAFMPLDFSIFRWIAIQGKVIYFFFFSTYWFIGIPMLLLILLGLVYVVKHRNKIFRNQLLQVVYLYIIIVCVHLILSALKMYPFSDRLFLYLAPGVYLLLGLGIEQIRRCYTLKRFRKLFFYAGMGIPLLAIVSYASYFPKKNNDVIGLIEFVNSTNQTIRFTPQAKLLTHNWLKFTGYFNEQNADIVEFRSRIKENMTTNFLIAIQSEKFGHKRKYTTPRPEIIHLLDREQIFVYKRIPGFVIYKYN